MLDSKIRMENFWDPVEISPENVPGLVDCLATSSRAFGVLQCVSYKLCLLVFKCLHDMAQQYLAELCVSVVDVTACRKLRFATRGQPNFPRYNMENYGRWAFSYAGPYAWNSLPEHLRQTTSIDLFRHSLKTFLFGQISRSEH